MAFSVGILYSSQTFLRIVQEGGLDLKNFEDSFSRIEVAEASAVLALSQNCRWVRVGDGGDIELTERGIGLSSIEAATDCLREQLLDLLVVEAPPWSKKIIQGRFEAAKSMPEGALQCFKDCDLLDGLDDPTVAWWDRASDSVRSERSKLNLVVGRRAERLSLEFEHKRTGKQPKWQAIETNVAGYDVLSVVATTELRSLKIEVKGSRLGRKEASFYLTRNEWNTATTTKDYHFHLWLIHEKPVLFLVPAVAMVKHVPTDGISGRWETSQLYYKDFTQFEHPNAA